MERPALRKFRNKYIKIEVITIFKFYGIIPRDQELCIHINNDYRGIWQDIMPFIKMVVTLFCVLITLDFLKYFLKF